MKRTVRIIFKIIVFPFRAVWWLLISPVILGLWAFNCYGDKSIKETYKAWLYDD